MTDEPEVIARRGVSLAKSRLLGSAAVRYLPACALGQTEGPAPEPKATPAQRKALMHALVTESAKTTVLGHLHPRRLRKDYE